MSIIDQLVLSTIRMECTLIDNSICTGTGYFFNFNIGEAQVPCVVTNKHVIKNASSAKFIFTTSKDGKPQFGNTEKFVLDNFEKICIPHPEAEIDLAILPIAPLVSNVKNLHIVYLDKTLIPDPDLLNTLSTMEDIVMIGYPNGIWDEENNLPIIRRGITATHPKLEYNGLPQFVIDAACFPGSSGSPVFLANIGSYAQEGGIALGTRIKLLGTLYAGPQYSANGEIVTTPIPTNNRVVSKTHLMMHLGYVIQSSKLNGFESTLRELIK